MDSKRSYTAWIVAAALVLLPCAYIASVGPVLYLDHNYYRHNTPEWVTTFYMPLLWLAQWSETVSGLLTWYLSLWGVG